MKLQHFEEINQRIKEEFLLLKREHPEKVAQKLTLSWSAWIFGLEPLADSLQRLQKAGIRYIELKGNHHTEHSGYDPDAVKALLAAYDMKVSGGCGLFSPDNDLASNSPYIRQRAIDYIHREVRFLQQVKADYFIVVPSAVGRPGKIDGAEFQRSVEALRYCGDVFVKWGIKAAIEPIRSAEVSLIHTIDQTLKYLEAVNHEGIAHINGDIYHMLLEERHTGEAILNCRERLVNLHIADSNRDALGTGMIDIDTIIMALYLIGFNQEGKYVTPEPLGPAADPYVLLHEECNQAVMDNLVNQTVAYFREREDYVLSLS